VLPGGADDPDKVSINLDQFHGNILLNLRDEEEKLRPFILFGLGATRSSGAGSSLTRFSFGLGAGVKYFFTQGMGVRLQARWAPTYLYSTSGGVWCNWWGFCWTLPRDNLLHQGDVSAGWIFRF
jgi:opacity protein-like surface antigen